MFYCYWIYILCQVSKKWHLQLNSSGQIGHDIRISIRQHTAMTSDLDRKIQFCTTKHDENCCL